MNSELNILLWLVVPVGLLFAGAGVVYVCLTLPFRRQERARFFLDLIVDGMKAGRSPEHTVIEASKSRDISMGARFHLVAAYIEQGLTLLQALDKAPRFLAPQVRAMIEAGEKTGSSQTVITSLRRFMKDALSQTRGATNYLLVLVLLASLIPAVMQLLTIFVFPKFKQIFADFDIGPLPTSTVFVDEMLGPMTVLMLAVCACTYLLVIAYIGGPRLAQRLRWKSFPLFDWIAYQLPWRRMRMLRNFGAMLGVLLDEGVPEEEAVRLGGNAAGNLIFQKRTEQVRQRLAGGQKLAEALGAMKETKELSWRVANASRGSGTFRTSLDAWLEAIDARGFQAEQTAAQAATSFLVLFNGAMVGLLAVGIFQAIIAIIKAEALW